MTIYIQIAGLLLAIIGAFYKKTIKTDSKGDMLYWHGLPKLTGTGILLLTLITSSSAISMYSNNLDKKRSSEEKRQLTGDLERLKQSNFDILKQIIADQQANIERSSLLINRLENSGKQTIDKIEHTSELLRENVINSSALLRRNITSRLFEVKKFRLTLFLDGVSIREDVHFFKDGRHVFEELIGTVPKTKSWIFVMPLGSMPSLQILIESNENPSECTIVLQDSKTLQKIQVGGFQVYYRDNKIVLNGEVSDFHLNQLKIDNLNMDTFIMAQDDSTLWVKFDKENQENIHKNFSQKLPKTIGVYIEPSLKIEDMPSSAWYFTLDRKFINETGDVIGYHYKRSRNTTSWDQWEFLGQRFDGAMWKTL